MPRNGAEVENVIFWGAGATRELGIRTTQEQGQFLSRVTGTKNPFGSASLEDRVEKALGDSNKDPWRSAVVDLIRILGDGDKAYESIHHIDEAEFDAMRRNWTSGAPDEEIRRRIIDLRLTYDWPALKSVVRICPGSTTDEFKLNDLFNLLDMHIPFGFGFRGPREGGDHPSTGDPSSQFLDARRLAGAKNALLMMLITLFYIDYQVCVASKPAILDQYKDVAIQLGRRIQRKGLSLARDDEALDTAKFYQGDVGFVSLNYDPILFWVQFVANRELNKSDNVPHIGSPAVPLYLFNDFGHFIPSRRIGKGDTRSPWYPMNEAIAQRLNEVKTGGDHKVRLTKILFPHGCLCWRECPDCGKLSSYLADQWDLAAVDLLPPPPLLAFSKGSGLDRVTDKEEREERAKGRIDARRCLHCGTLNFANHTQLVMQSSFKAPPPSFIGEIQRDLRAMTMRARHIIFMGYSLPPDDVTYRAFFSATSQRDGSAEPLRCTVVNKDENNPGWSGPDEILARRSSFGKSADAVLTAAHEVFGKEKVRFYGGGVPGVFLDGDRATEAKLEKLLVWS